MDAVGTRDAISPTPPHPTPSCASQPLLIRSPANRPPPPHAQLCDLALHEPGGDSSLRVSLLHMSAASCALALALWYFLRSVQVTTPPLSPSPPFLRSAQARA